MLAVYKHKTDIVKRQTASDLIRVDYCDVVRLLTEIITAIANTTLVLGLVDNYGTLIQYLDT